MIRFQNVCKEYSRGTQRMMALNNVSLTVAPGEIFGVIGHSGAGKSTLLHCANLLERPTLGQVFIDETDITHYSDLNLRTIRHKIGMIFQHFNLLSSKTVFDNIALPLRLAGHSKKEIDHIVSPLLAFTGLEDKRLVFPHHLSGGQKQRVAIARALVNKPKVLLCDEATSALDPNTTQTILQLLKKINQEFNLTILLITHEMDVIRQICDRVALLHRGEILEQDSAINFFLKPKTDLAKQFIRSNFHEHLPDDLQLRLLPQKTVDSNYIVRLTFKNEVVREPIIANLTQHYQLYPNILQATIERIGNTHIGVMLLEIVGKSSAIEQGIGYLQQLGVQVESIGYVANATTIAN